MKRDNLAQTWQEKFAAFELNEEYLYQYVDLEAEYTKVTEQLEKARKAVESENRKKEMLLELNAKRTTFSIRKLAASDKRKHTASYLRDC